MAIIEFKPDLHPRNRLGQFQEVLRGLKVGDKVRLPNKTVVERRKGGSFRVTSGRYPRGIRKGRFDTWSPHFAAKAGLDAAAHSPLMTHPPKPGQVGGFQDMKPEHLSVAPASPGTNALKDAVEKADKDIAKGEATLALMRKANADGAVSDEDLAKAEAAFLHLKDSTLLGKHIANDTPFGKAVKDRVFAATYKPPSSPGTKGLEDPAVVAAAIAKTRADYAQPEGVSTYFDYVPHSLDDLEARLAEAPTPGLRRAAIQSVYSMWSRGYQGVAPTSQQTDEAAHAIAVVADSLGVSDLDKPEHLTVADLMQEPNAASRVRRMNSLRKGSTVTDNDGKVWTKTSVSHWPAYKSEDHVEWTLAGEDGSFDTRHERESSTFALEGWLALGSPDAPKSPGVDEPNYDEDYFFSPSGPLGSRTSLSGGGKFIGEFSSDEEAIAAAHADMDKNGYYPNLWQVDDHGGVELHTPDAPMSPGTDAKDWDTVQTGLRDGSYGDWPAIRQWISERWSEDNPDEGLGTSDVNHIAFGMVGHELRPVSDLPEHPSNSSLDLAEDYSFSPDLETRLAAGEKLRKVTGMSPTEFLDGMRKLFAPAEPESPGTVALSPREQRKKDAEDTKRLLARIRAAKAMQPQGAASPGTDDTNAARSARIFDISVEKSALADEWRVKKASPMADDQARAVELWDQIQKLEDERLGLVQDINATYPTPNTPKAVDLKPDEWKIVPKKSVIFGGPTPDEVSSGADPDAPGSLGRSTDAPDAPQSPGTGFPRVTGSVGDRIDNKNASEKANALNDAPTGARLTLVGQTEKPMIVKSPDDARENRKNWGIVAQYTKQDGGNWKRTYGGQDYWGTPAELKPEVASAQDLANIGSYEQSLDSDPDMGYDASIGGVPALIAAQEDEAASAFQSGLARAVSKAAPKSPGTESPRSYYDEKSGVSLDYQDGVGWKFFDPVNFVGGSAQPIPTDMAEQVRQTHFPDQPAITPDAPKSPGTDSGDEIQQLLGPRPASVADANARTRRHWYLTSLKNASTGAPLYDPLTSARIAAEEDKKGLLRTMPRQYGGQGLAVQESLWRNYFRRSGLDL